jgi:trehalose 6-phosphate phosphatase
VAIEPRRYNNHSGVLNRVLPAVAVSLKAGPDALNNMQEMNKNHVPAFTDNWALFLDVDGTLLEHAEHPDAVQIPPDLGVMLSALRQHVPLALISGRSLASLDSLFQPSRFPAAGQHGAERRDEDGFVHRRERPPGLSELKWTLASYVKSHAGLLLEDKGNSLAVHYRRAPHLQQQITTLVQNSIRNRADYHLLSGKLVLEVREAGITKGTSIRSFMGERPFAGCLPVFLGDDTTDEDGFAQVREIGGHGIKVGEGLTCADWRLDCVLSVLNWLREYSKWLARHVPESFR